MKQFLLPGVAAMISISGMAADLNTMQPQKAVNHAAQAKAEKMVAIKSDAKVLKRIALSNRAEMQVCRSADGRVYKRIVTNLNNSAIKPFAKVQARAESSDETPCSRTSQAMTEKQQDGFRQVSRSSTTVIATESGYMGSYRPIKSLYEQYRRLRGFHLVRYGLSG